MVIGGVALTPTHNHDNGSVLTCIDHPVPQHPSPDGVDARSAGFNDWGEHYASLRLAKRVLGISVQFPGELPSRPPFRDLSLAVTLGVDLKSRSAALFGALIGMVVPVSPDVPVSATVPSPPHRASQRNRTRSRARLFLPRPKFRRIYVRTPHQP
jgi:hypothetical protein